MNSSADDDGCTFICLILFWICGFRSLIFFGTPRRVCVRIRFLACTVGRVDWFLATDVCWVFSTVFLFLQSTFFHIMNRISCFRRFILGSDVLSIRTSVSHVLSVFSAKL